jgi:hypothetical protein
MGPGCEVRKLSTAQSLYHMHMKRWGREEKNRRIDLLLPVVCVHICPISDDIGEKRRRRVGFEIRNIGRSCKSAIASCVYVSGGLGCLLFQVLSITSRLASAQ